MISETLKAKLEELPEDLKREVLDYVEFLLHKYGKKTKRGSFKFDWEGGFSINKTQIVTSIMNHAAF